MGASESKLEKYCFQTTESHGIDWQETSIYLIEDTEKLEIALEIIQNYHVLYVDLEGSYFGNQNSHIGLIQIAAEKNLIFLFDIIQCPTAVSSLKKILESESIIKVFHDCSGDAAALYNACYGEIMVKNAFDTQVAQKIIETRESSTPYSVAREYNLSDLYSKLTDNPFPRINVKSYGNNKWTEKRPMSDMIKYSAVDVMVLPEIYDAQKSRMTQGEVARCFTDTSKKLTYKVPVQADSDVRYSPSLEGGASGIGGTRRGTGGQLQREEQGFSVGLAIAAVVAVGVGVLTTALLAGNKKK